MMVFTKNNVKVDGFTKNDVKVNALHEKWCKN